MAAQAEESIRTPQVVANTLVEQYYNKLTESPEEVYKFYQNSSVISRPDLDGLMSSVSTVEEIDKMILSFDYKNSMIEILTIDAQGSFCDGVIVLVTGFLTGKDNVRRKFTQLFFLAPQDSNRYYVLNDMFRYVDEEEVISVKIDDSDDTAPIAPVTPDPEPTLISNQSVLDHTIVGPSEDDTAQAEEFSHPMDNEKISIVDEIISSHSVDTSQNDSPSISVGTDQIDASPVSEAAVSNVQADTPKKSYASVANELNYKKQPFQQKILPAKPVQQFCAPVAPEPSPHLANSKSMEKNNSSSVVKGYSIFVANLPMNATVEQLIETFEKFGPIKPNGVQVRSYKQEKNCFGFVEFESANSVQSALEVGSIHIGERLAHIEEKKANNEGGKFPPRKGGFRGDNFRSRGNFGVGRGYGRNEYDNQGGLSGQSRGAGRRNEKASQKIYQNVGGRGARQIQAQSQTESKSPSST